MFSNTEYQYIKDLTISYYNKDYVNYLCYTNNPNNSYNQSYYDIYCYYSKNEISKNNNKYTIPNESILCNIDTKSPTSTYKNNSLVCQNNSGTVEVSNKEFIYSNIDNNSNIIGEYELLNKMNNDISLYVISILFMIILIYLYRFIRAILRG